MKNKSLIILSFLLVLQGVSFPVVNIKCGIERSDLFFSYDGNEEWGKQNRLRLGAGFSSSYSRRFVFQPEAYFVQKGSKVTKSYLGKDLTQKIILEYIEFPLLFRYSLKSRKKINIGLLFGPFMGIKLRAMQDTEFQNDNRTENIEDGFTKTDFGFVYGIELVIIKEKFNLFMDFRFTSGSTNIRKNRNFRESIKNRSLSLMMGIGF